MLAELLQLDVFKFLLVFTRLGTAIMLLPGLGGQLVSKRIRLCLALAVSFLMLPLLGRHFVAVPPTYGGVILLVFGEVVVGAFIGTIVMFIMSVLSLAGSMIGYQVGLTNAFSFDPIAQQQSQLVTSFLTNVAMLGLFVTDLHHMMFVAIVESYDLFPPGLPLPWGDFTETLSHLVTETFKIGTQFAMPLIVFGLMFYSGLGLLSRLVAQLQIFFIAQPVQILVGIWMFLITLPMVLGLFLRFFETTLHPYMIPR
ncbi:flagellar biosynthetic protein FliR [Magnetospirillum sp. SS-4]|uniref:flagellar biosynthetic protein FliR n=1 Tax=Magnetospirillum sp. SS-4 TaxID=2681465 RepID=UPI00137C6205|nr:flagellar biosynthetic protein FliR [Magnetospirillum sp. SS-4]CAA7617504.1 Flagellar biosynthetic protein fliR [Magnetospirillum sp. SS-4]